MKRFFSSDNLWRLFLGAGLAAGCILIYGRTLGFDFVAFDDDINLTLNSHLGPPTLARIHWMFTDSATILRYVPLGWLFYSCIFAVGGMDPSWYHGAALVLHVFNTLLVFLLIQRIIDLGGLAGSDVTDRRWAASAAALGAAFWAMHPLRVEPVTWCTGLLYVYSCSWMLLSALAYCSALGRYAACGRWGGLLVMSVVLYAISLLSYPLALGFPLVMAALTIWKLNPGEGLLNRLSISRSSLHASVGIALMLLLSLAAALVAVRVRAGGGDHWATPTGLEQFTFVQRVAQGAFVLVNSLIKTLFPLNLSPVYQDLEIIDPSQFRFYGSILACLLLGLVVWTQRRRSQGLVLFAAAFAALAAPFLGFLEHPFFPCDRYTLIPGTVLGVALGCAFVRLKTKIWRLFATGFALMVLLTFGVISHAQTTLWKDSEHLYSAVVGKLKGQDFRAFYIKRWVIVRANEGRFMEARELLATAIVAHAGSPSMSDAATSLVRAEALSAHMGNNQSVPPIALELNRMAIEAAKQDRRSEAQARFLQTLRFAPSFQEARFNYAILLARDGQPQRALAQYFWLQGTAGEALSENYPKLLEIIGLSYQLEGQDGLGKACLERAERLTKSDKGKQ